MVDPKGAAKAVDPPGSVTRRPTDPGVDAWIVGDRDVEVSRLRVVRELLNKQAHDWEAGADRKRADVNDDVAVSSEAYGAHLRGRSSPSNDSAVVAEDLNVRQMEFAGQCLEQPDVFLGGGRQHGVRPGAVLTDEVRFQQSAAAFQFLCSNAGARIEPSAANKQNASTLKIGVEKVVRLAEAMHDALAVAAFFTHLRLPQCQTVGSVRHVRGSRRAAM